MIFDLAVIVAYMVLINLIGFRYGKSGSVNDYFLGSRSISWPIACFSIVATETSTLTFISIPGLAYATNLGFLQLAIGYIAGRVLVALFLIPRYFEGNVLTAYELLQQRFGPTSRRALALLFHVTRLLSDSVRLFATALPLAMLIVAIAGIGAENAGTVTMGAIVLTGIVTFAYTCVGGLRAVAITDAIQLFVYLGAAIFGLVFVTHLVGLPFFDIIAKIPAGKLTVFNSGMGEGGAGLFTSYNAISGLIGGMVLSFASHGTDHLLVQRILSCKDKRDAQKAMVLSGFVVFLQFGLFMILGLFIYILFGGETFAQPDRIMPAFIIERCVPGLRGLMLAGIFAAAMSTLSSSINSLSSSTSFDLLRLQDRGLPEERLVRYSRVISLVWSVVVVAIALSMQGVHKSLVELALTITSFPYGGMLGIFVLAITTREFNEKAALTGVVVGIAATGLVAMTGKVFWPWYAPTGFLVSLVTGIAVHLALRKLQAHRGALTSSSSPGR